MWSASHIAAADQRASLHDDPSGPRTLGKSCVCFILSLHNRNVLVFRCLSDITHLSTHSYSVTNFSVNLFTSGTEPRGVLLHNLFSAFPGVISKGFTLHEKKQLRTCLPILTIPLHARYIN